MIKNNECIIEITSKNIKYYTDRSYPCNIGDIISIDISTMPRMSHNVITAICDICYSENSLMFSKYNKNFERQGFYSCKKCSGFKRKKTVLEKYGIENISQKEENREKMRTWMGSKEFRETSKKTQIENHGCLYVQTDKHINFMSSFHKERISILKEKGEYFTSLSSPENSNLKKIGMYNKYGYECSFLAPLIKDKIQNTNMERFGHISPLGNKDIQKLIKEKIIYKSLEKESYFNGDVYKINQFKIYRTKVRYQTNIKRKMIFESWDGHDYYDGEYIKDYLSLNKTNNKYPSIDHKISCFYGYINNLPPEEISNIENLCITKRIINSHKRYLNEKEFVEIFNSSTI